MKNIGNVEVSFFDTYYKPTINGLQFSIEYRGKLFHSDVWDSLFQTADSIIDRSSKVDIILGTKGLSIEWRRRPCYDSRLSHCDQNKDYELTILKRTFWIGIQRHTMASQHLKFGLSCGYEWAQRYLIIDIGLFELSVEWLVKPSRVWLKRVRHKFYSRKAKDLKQSGFVKGTDEYNAEMAKALKSHDNEMGDEKDYE